MTAVLRRPVTREVLGIAAALGAGLLLPVLVHLIPVEGGPPAGARLLPIFVAPLLAALRLSPVSALAIAVGSPLLNHLLTGRPAGALLGRMEIELIIFTLLVLWARHLPRHHLAWIAPSAYLAGAAVAALLLAPHATPWLTMVQAPLVAWPGLLALAALGFVLKSGGER